MSSKYDEEQVVADLNRKHDIHIQGKQIMELTNNPGKGGMHSRGDVGIRSKGKIDFLVHYRHYSHFYVASFK